MAIPAVLTLILKETGDARSQVVPTVNGYFARAPLIYRGMARRHFWVSGRVQGVWYRGACAEQAHALGISGWARNLPDGRVEIAAEGSPEALDKLVEWCRHGPPAARVSAVEVQVEEPEGLAGFEVR